MIFKIVGDFSNDELSNLLFGKTVIGRRPIQNCKLIRCGSSIPFKDLGLENFTVSDAQNFQVLSLPEFTDYTANNTCYILTDIKVPIDGVISDTRQKLSGHMLVETYPFGNKTVYVYRRVDFYNY